MIYKDGWKCMRYTNAWMHFEASLISSTDIILASCDVEGNFTVVKVSSLFLVSCYLWSANPAHPRLTNTRISFHVCSSMRESLFRRARMISKSPLLDGQSLYA